MVRILPYAAVALLFIFTQASSIWRRVGGTPVQNAGRNTSKDICDIFTGRWVYEESSTSYDPVAICPFVGGALNCLKNGRPDTTYLKYRWQPTDCDLPRFDGRDFLERMRGKKVMFVGDSLSSNMWESLICLLLTAVPAVNHSITNGSLSTFSIPEFEVSIMFQKNGFLVRLESHEGVGRVLKLDALLGSEQWECVDVLVFNSYHWWIHTGRYQTWDYYQVGGEIVEGMGRMEAYKIALETWANWVNERLPNSTAVFFQGISAVHASSGDFDYPTVRSCVNQSRPVEGSVFWGPPYPGEEIIRRVVEELSKPCLVLDFTLLTHLRPDAHPSVYANTTSPDCSHWCLPGVPDTWNQLFYVSLFQD